MTAIFPNYPSLHYSTLKPCDPAHCCTLIASTERSDALFARSSPSAKRHRAAAPVGCRFSRKPSHTAVTDTLQPAHELGWWQQGDSRTRGPVCIFGGQEFGKGRAVQGQRRSRLLKLDVCVLLNDGGFGVQM